MATTVRHPMTLEFDVMFYGRREGEDWLLFYQSVDSDGGEFHVPSEVWDEDDEETRLYETALAEEVDRAVGILNEEDWDDLTPDQRVQVVKFMTGEEL